MKYPRELSDSELADYVVEQTPDDIDPRQVEEFFRGAKGLLKKFALGQLQIGPEDNHLEKYPAWDQFDPDTAPPLVVENDVIVDGHHRYRSALKVGAPYVWAYDVVGDEE